MPASKDARALDAEEVAASLHGRVRQAGAHEFVYVQDLVDALRQSLGHDRHEGVANQTVSMTLNKALEDQQKAGVLKLFSKKKSSGGNAPKFMGIKLARDVSAAPAAAGSAPHAAGSAAASAAASGGADGSAAAASAACTSVAGIWDETRVMAERDAALLELDENKQAAVRVAKERQVFIDTSNAPIFGIDSSGLVNEWNKKVADNQKSQKTSLLGLMPTRGSSPQQSGSCLIK